ncbi:hypothetical protein TVAGG3_0588870, partial [Trichomonas vaginalis G3]
SSFVIFPHLQVFKILAKLGRKNFYRTYSKQK